jgi:hypothetical protein
MDGWTGPTTFDATERIKDGAALGLSTQCWQIRTDKLLLAEHKCIGFELWIRSVSLCTWISCRIMFWEKKNDKY